MNQETIRMTLTGPYAGKTMMLNGREFVDGIHDVTDQPEHVGSITKYYVRCYQVALSNPAVEEIPQVEVDEEVVEPEEPNERQQAIIAAVNGIDREEWIEQDTNPHPKVKDVATLMEDPTIKKEEILEVIEKWLS